MIRSVHGLLLGVSMAWASGAIAQAGTSTWVPVELDPQVKARVEACIDTTQADIKRPGEDVPFIYANCFAGSVEVNDSLVSHVTEADARKSVFKSFYGFVDDTLVIDGGYGFFGGFGFTARVAGGRADVRHLAAADEEPLYTAGPTDTLCFRLEVPCTGVRFVLSQPPDPNAAGPIYGYVEFSSNVYYSGKGAVDGVEVLPRDRCRMAMRIHFRSVRIDGH